MRTQHEWPALTVPSSLHKLSAVTTSCISKWVACHDRLVHIQQPRKQSTPEIPSRTLHQYFHSAPYAWFACLVHCSHHDSFTFTVHKFSTGHTKYPRNCMRSKISSKSQGLPERAASMNPTLILGTGIIQAMIRLSMADGAQAIAAKHSLLHHSLPHRLRRAVFRSKTRVICTPILQCQA